MNIKLIHHGCKNYETIILLPKKGYCNKFNKVIWLELKCLNKTWAEDWEDNITDEGDLELTMDDLRED